jgi:hypothetical protein
MSDYTVLRSSESLTGLEMSAVVNEVNHHPVTGLVPPQTSEAVIREAYPSVTAFPAVASLGKSLILSIIGAPLGWGLMLPFYFLKILPGFAVRYALTNRRLMILKGWAQAAIPHMRSASVKPSAEVALADIDEVRIQTDANSEFFRSATLEIISHGNVALTLVGVPEPESFRQSIINALKAWVPGKAQGPFVPAKAP